MFGDFVGHESGRGAAEVERWSRGGEVNLGRLWGTLGVLFGVNGPRKDDSRSLRNMSFESKRRRRCRALLEKTGKTRQLAWPLPPGEKKRRKITWNKWRVHGMLPPLRHTHSHTHTAHTQPTPSKSIPTCGVGRCKNTHFYCINQGAVTGRGSL